MKQPEMHHLYYFIVEPLLTWDWNKPAASLTWTGKGNQNEEEIRSCSVNCGNGQVSFSDSVQTTIEVYDSSRLLTDTITPLAALAIPTTEISPKKNIPAYFSE